MSFRPTARYNLSTHTINFDQNGVEVILDSTGVKVDGATFTAGFEIKVIDEDFCFGEILFDDHFDRAISLVDPDGGFIFDEPTSEIVGSDELDNPSVTRHIWDISSCPIRLRKDGTDVIVRCPCTGTPCENKCYSTK